MYREKLIDGKMVSELIQIEIKKQIDELIINRKPVPTLTIIQVGDNSASTTYIKNKKIVFEKVGIICNILNYDHKINEKELIKIITVLNHDQTVDGILVQLPLPPQISSQNIIKAIAIGKDVDGFSSHILGDLMLGNSTLLPATPKGIMALFKFYNINLIGKHVVIVGRSNIVGKPLASLVLNASATVTVCHSKTKNLADFTKQADILVAAVGQEKLITAEMVKDNAIVIDVGTNYDKHNKLCGDVDFDKVIKKVKLITPVPGGVGPMTITALLENILYIYQLKHSKNK